MRRITCANDAAVGQRPALFAAGLIALVEHPQQFRMLAEHP
jgi:hypothetical protein